MSLLQFLLLSYVLVFLAWRHVGSKLPDGRDLNHTPYTGRQSLNHQTTRAVWVNSLWCSLVPPPGFFEEPRLPVQHVFSWLGSLSTTMWKVQFVSCEGHRHLPAAIIWGSCREHWVMLSTPPASTTELRASRGAGALWWLSAGSPRTSSDSAKAGEHWGEKAFRGKSVVYFKQKTTASKQWRLAVAGTEAKPPPCRVSVSEPERREGPLATTWSRAGWINSLSVERLVPGLQLNRLHKRGLSGPAQPPSHTAHQWRGQTGATWDFF